MSDAVGPAATLYPTLPSEHASAGHSAASGEAGGVFQAPDVSSEPGGDETAVAAPEAAEAAIALEAVPEFPGVDFREPPPAEGESFEWAPEGAPMDQASVEARAAVADALADIGMGPTLGSAILDIVQEAAAAPTQMTYVEGAEALNERWGDAAAAVLDAAREMARRFDAAIPPGPAKARIMQELRASGALNSPHLVELLARRRMELQW